MHVLSITIWFPFFTQLKVKIVLNLNCVGEWWQIKKT